MAGRIRDEDSERVGALLKPRLLEVYGRWEAASGGCYDGDSWYRILVQAIQRESSTLEQMVALCDFALAAEDLCIARRMERWTEEARGAWQDSCSGAVLRRCLDTLNAEHLATPEAAAQYFQELRRYFRDTAGVRGQRVMSSVRAVLTGSMTGPCLGIVASLLGWERCVDRIRDAMP